MKKQFVLAICMAFTGMVNAQTLWDYTGNNFSGGITPVLGSNSGTYPIVFRTAGLNQAILTANGDMGLGVTNPLAKLDVFKQIPSNTTSSPHIGINSELTYVAGMSFFPWFSAMAVSGKATSFTSGYGYQIGVYGEGKDGQINYGGHFASSGSTPLGGPSVLTNFGVDASATGDVGYGNFGGNFTALGNGGFNVGTHATASGNGDYNTGVAGIANGNPTVGQNIGVHGNAIGNPVAGIGNVGGFFQYSLSSNPANDWAVWSMGSSFSTGGWWPSDRMLKDNIKPITNALEKIMLLKPSTYTYRTEEFKDMNLPAGEQTGLIAQELGAVFPNFVKKAGNFKVQSEGQEPTSIPEFTAVNYINLFAVLIAGMQEQQKQIEDLRAQVATSQLNGGLNTGSDGFVLEQNIPNPFSSETKINYSFPQQVRNASLIVYDLTGRQISSLPLDTKGSSVTLTSEKLPAGIYIYSVMADGKIMDSKRMVVGAKQ